MEVALVPTLTPKYPLAPADVPVPLAPPFTLAAAVATPTPVSMLISALVAPLAPVRLIPPIPIMILVEDALLLLLGVHAVHVLNREQCILARAVAV